MKKICKNILTIVFCISLTACGTTSTLKPVSGNVEQHIDLTGYDVVSVQDFKCLAAGCKNRVDSIIIGGKYAGKIASKLSSETIFDKVTRREVDGKAILIKGEITRYDDGDPALRMVVGFGAGSANFDADVYLIDNETKENIGFIKVDKNSWPLGGVLGMSQDANVLMDYSVNKVASQIIKAKTTPVASSE